MSDNEEKKIFSANLRHYIEVSGKMQIDVAKDLGVAIQTFNGWCNEVSIPSMGKVQKLADYFGIGKSDLLDKKTDDFQSHLQLTEDEEDLLIQIRSNQLSEQAKRMVAYMERLNESGYLDLLRYAKLLSNSDEYKKED